MALLLSSPIYSMHVECIGIDCYALYVLYRIMGLNQYLVKMNTTTKAI